MAYNSGAMRQLPQEINAEITVKFGIPVRIFFVGALMFAFARNTVASVYAPFEIAWYIWNVLIGLILCIKTKQNCEKSFGYSLVAFLSRGCGEYKSIDNPKKFSEMKVSVTDETPDKECI